MFTKTLPNFSSIALPVDGGNIVQNAPAFGFEEIEVISTNESSDESSLYEISEEEHQKEREHYFEHMICPSVAKICCGNMSEDGAETYFWCLSAHSGRETSTRSGPAYGGAWRLEIHSWKVVQMSKVGDHGPILRFQWTLIM